jgi:hypothetical protein
MTTRKFAAIGSDGTREVVWGLGDSEEAAEAEALREAAASDVDPELTRTVEISDDVDTRIRAGEVDCEGLGI